MTTLIIECEGSEPARVELPPGEYSIGADSANAIVIDHPTVSSHHCDLFVQADGRAIVLDAESTNGTWIDGATIGKAGLAPGRSFQIGAARITLENPIAVNLPPRLPAAVPASGKITPGRSGTAKALPNQSFFQELPGAFLYPLRGQAYLYIFIVVGMELAQPFLPAIMGLFISIVIGCYLLQIWQQIVFTTIDGADQLPDLPNMTMDWKESFNLYLRYFILVLFCLIPVYLYYFSKMWGWGLPPWTLYIGFALSGIYLPMALLAFLMTESFAVLSPVFMVRSIMRKLPEYLFLVGALALFLAASYWLAFVVLPSDAEGVSKHSRPLIMGGNLLSGVIGLYLVFVWMRLLGLFYRHFKVALAWV